MREGARRYGTIKEGTERHKTQRKCAKGRRKIGTVDEIRETVRQVHSEKRGRTAADAKACDMLSK